MKRLALSAVGAALTANVAVAQVPVFDQATFSKAEETARNAVEILRSSEETMKLTQKTLEAVTGERQDGNAFSQIGVGSGFSVSQMPSLDDIFSGGSFSFGNIDPNISKVASALINGLSLLEELRGFSEGTESSTNKNYLQAVQTASQLAALIAGSRDAASQRTQALRTAAGQVGQSQDLKGALDQNTMMQVQQGLTTNELVGTMNGAVTALQQQIMDDLVEQSGMAELLEHDADADPFAK